MIRRLLLVTVLALAVPGVAIAAPVISGIDPIRGPATGGTTVTITGSGFTDVTSVRFGAKDAQSFNLVSDTSITAVSPPGSGVVYYYPIYEGTCTGVPLSVAATRATMTYNSTSYCTALDVNATGRLVHDGKLTLSRELVSGTVLMAQSDADTETCTTNILDTDWCRPTGADANKNVVFIGASIVTPGGKPQGQQNNVDDLKFYFSIRGGGRA